MPEHGAPSSVPAGVIARLGALVAAVLLAVVADGHTLGVVFVLCGALAVLMHPAGFRILGRPALWVLLAALALPPLLLTSPRDLDLPLGLAVSGAGVALAVSMAARSLVIAVAAAGFEATVSVRELTGLFEFAGLRGLGFSLGVAVHALPVARQTWATSARALRLRGGLRWHWARDVALLGMTVVGNALRHADEVVEAAHARGFSPDRHERTPPDHWQADLVWIAVLAAAAVMILVE